MRASLAPVRVDAAFAGAVARVQELSAYNANREVAQVGVGLAAESLNYTVKSTARLEKLKNTLNVATISSVYWQLVPIAEAQE